MGPVHESEYCYQSIPSNEADSRLNYLRSGSGWYIDLSASMYVIYIPKTKIDA